MITKLHIQNFKCLRDVSVDLEPFTVLIGKNDTGKTSFLQAVEVLADLVSVSPVSSWPVKKLAWRGADPVSIKWTAEIAPSPRNGLPGAAQYSLCISPPVIPDTSCYIAEESVTVQGAGVHAGYERRSDAEVLVLEDGGEKSEGITPTRDQSALSRARKRRRAYPTLEAIAEALSGVAQYHFDPERLNEPSAFQTRNRDPDELPRLARDGDGLPLVLDYLLGAKRKTFDAIERDLHEAVPFIKAIQLRPWTSDDGRAGKSLSFEVADTNYDVSADLASDGVLLFLAYLTLVHSGNSPAILLIEEPETGIHPRQLQRIAAYLQGLTDVSRGANAVQIILATHSPYFLDFVSPDCVRVFGRKPNGETVVAPLLDLPGVKKRLESGFSLGEMWFNVGEDKLLAEVLQ
jgi:predicted ATPase